MSVASAARGARPALHGMGPLVSVPGKLFLAGEYAVLEGGAAVLTAVGRTATAVFVPGLVPATPLVAAACAHAKAALQTRGFDLPAGAARVDTSTFMRAGTKLGLGSSAAAAVAAVAAAFAHSGLDVESEHALLRATADAAHRAAQGGVGSGADIAASVHGGFLRFVRAPESGPPNVTIAHLEPPPDLHMVTFWTRSAARTTDFIGGVERLRRDRPAVHARCLADLRAAAGDFASAFATSATATVMAAAHCYAAMVALGEEAALPIVMPVVAEAAALAARLGGAAKPSGAGGGDMGIGFFGDKGAADQFVAQCPAGVLVLEIPLGASGARLGSSSSVSNFKKD